MIFCGRSSPVGRESDSSLNQRQPRQHIKSARPKMVLAISPDFQYLAIPSGDRPRSLTSNHLQMAEGRNYDRIVVKGGSRERPLRGPGTKFRANADWL